MELIHIIKTKYIIQKNPRHSKKKVLTILPNDFCFNNFNILYIKYHIRYVIHGIYIIYIIHYVVQHQKIICIPYYLIHLIKE